MALACSGALIALALVQLPFAAVFLRALRRRPPPLPADAECGRALVVLPLRGSDPSLGDCITALIHQDYPRYDVRIILDRPDDPAGPVVASVLAAHPASNVRVETLRSRGPTCSLKCSSLVQAVHDLDASYTFVAQLDADTVPHPTWLREMASGFEDPDVGVVTGNRWYAPVTPTWGALVRYLWNAAALPQMYVYRIAWGGSMAIRADVIDAARLREHWSRAYGEDTALTSALRPTGLRVRFLPSLMMVDQEACTLRQFDEWVRRQLISARLHHPAWVLVAGHGAATSLALALVGLLGIARLAQGNVGDAFLCLGAFACYQAVMAGALLPMEAGVRRVVRGREGFRPPSGVAVLKCALAIPLAQAWYARALAAAALATSVTWRGARYDLVGGGRIRLAHDGGTSGGSPPIPGTGGTP